MNPPKPSWPKAIIALFVTLASFAPTNNAFAASCTIIFNNQTALRNVVGGSSPDELSARETFALFTSSISGKPVYCDPNAGFGECWIYREQCGANYVHVEAPTFLPYFAASDTLYDHIHLGFRDTSLQSLSNNQCFFMDPHDGHGPGYSHLVNGVCQTPPDYSTQARVAYAHLWDGWLTIYMTTSQFEQVPFTLTRLSTFFSGAPHAQMWYLDTNGTWHEFSANVIPTSQWISMPQTYQIMLRAVDSSSGPVVVNNFDITGP